MTRVLSIGLALLLAVVLYRVGWIYFERGETGRTAGPARRLSGVPVELLGSDLKIMAFYANAPFITTEESATICYGVLNAARVEIDPPVARVPPSLNRCIEVSPKQDTSYTLKATSAAGQSVEASFTLPVRPAPARFLHANVSGFEIKRGQPVTFCYGVKNASQVKLEPTGQTLAPVEKTCLRWYPAQTLNYRVTATGPGGAAEPLKFTIKVK
jgi:hypothetical protein